MKILSKILFYRQIKIRREISVINRKDFCEFPDRVTIVESIPENLTYSSGSPTQPSTFEAWINLIESANKTIDIVAFYWTLLGSDVGYDDPSDKQVFRIVLVLYHHHHLMAHCVIYERL